jgi:ATP-binding cassette subfamily B protein
VTVGVLTAFLAYIGRFYGRLDSMSRIVSVTQKAAAGAKRIFDILDHVSNVPDPAQPVPFGKAKRGAQPAAACTSAMAAAPSSRSLDLDIRPGEMVGLVGHSRFGQEHAGEPDLPLLRRDRRVSIKHRRRGPAPHQAVSDYRRHIGLVLQEPFLFFGTIAENIAYGKPERHARRGGGRRPRRARARIHLETAARLRLAWWASAARA